MTQFLNEVIRTLADGYGVIIRPSEPLGGKVDVVVTVVGPSNGITPPRSRSSLITAGMIERNGLGAYPDALLRAKHELKKIL